MGLGLGLGLGLSSGQQQPAPRVPSRADWETLRPLGGGAQGTTYLVKRKHDKDKPQTFVLKELKKQEDEQARARFNREVTNLQGLQDRGTPNVVESNASAYQSLQPLFLVLEYIPGPTLKQYIGGKLIDLADALKLTLELLRILEYCHGVPVIHRDIKPGNIVLRDGSVSNPVVVDFGLSFNLDTDDELTMSGEAVGNSCLRLPEQSQSSPNKRRIESDVTQVCGLLVFAVTGKCPEELQDAHEGLKPHRRAAFQHAAKGYDETNLKRICEVLDRAFNHRLEDRWRSAKECREAMEAALGFKETASALEDRTRALGAKYAAVASSLARRNPNAISAELAPATSSALNSVAKHVDKMFEAKFQESIDEHAMEMRHIIRFSPVVVGLTGLAVELRAHARGNKIHVVYRRTADDVQPIGSYELGDPAPVEQLRVKLQAALVQSLEELLPPDEA